MFLFWPLKPRGINSNGNCLATTRGTKLNENLIHKLNWCYSCNKHSRARKLSEGIYENNKGHFRRICYYTASRYSEAQKTVTLASDLCQTLVSHAAKLLDGLIFLSGFFVFASSNNGCNIWNTKDTGNTGPVQSVLSVNTGRPVSFHLCTTSPKWTATEVKGAGNKNINVAPY